MFSLNKVILIGSITEPETRTTQSGVSVTNFSLATDRSWKEKDGNWKKETDWHNIVAFNVSEYILENIGKGTKLAVEGEVRTESFEKDGQKRYITKIYAKNIVLLDKKESNNSVTSDGSNEDLPF